MDPIGWIATTVRGCVTRGNDATPGRIVHDSREIAEGDLFVALRGRRADGHAHLGDAFARGACGALLSDPSAAPEDAPNLIVVDDTLAALHRLASAWRRRLAGTLVGITGSNGKTTTRALLAHLLRAPNDANAVFSAPKNYNTEVGLPLAVLAMPETTAIGLFELGAERPGDIALLADILVPDVGLITSIGPSHLDGFGSVEAVAQEKWSLIERLPEGALVVLSADAPKLRGLVETSARPCLTVGLGHGDIRGRILRDVPRLELAVDDPPMIVDCPLIGAHNATNLLLATITAARLGVSPETIRERAGTFEPVPHRLQPIDASVGTILDDTYNANPASTAGALRALARLGDDRTRRTFVFGEMRDLGPDSARYHREALGLALRLGIDAILPVGEQAVDACRERPSPAIRIVERATLPEMIRALHREADERIILVKGSRALGLERLVDRLTT